MAFSSVTIPADGSTDVFTFSFSYLIKDHVSVYKNGVLVPGRTFPTASSVKLNTAVTNGDIIVIQRVTPREALTVLIPNSGTFRGKDINAQSLQTLFIAQEAFDSLTSVVQLDTTDGTMDANGYRIKNVANPVNAQDAVTKNWAETAMSSQLAQAITARTTAQSAAASATADKNTVAADKAIVAADKATVITDKGIVAADKATVAADKATVAADKGIVAADKATVAADKATVAADKATVASDKALTLSYKNAVEALLDLFGDRYLGDHSTNPTVDNDGDPLIEGALYWNSTVDEMRVWTGTVWMSFIVSYTNAAGLPFTPGGNLSATNVQAALIELDSEKSDVGHNHDSRYYTESEVDSLLGAKAKLPQSWGVSGFLEKAANKTYTLILNIPHGVTITDVVSKCASGSCTLTAYIDGVALGGTANSVTTSEQTRSHSSANVAAAGTDITIVITSNASAKDVAFTLKGSRTLAAT